MVLPFNGVIMDQNFLYRVAAVITIFVVTIATAYANTPEQIFVQASPSVVVIDILDGKGQPIGLGSGAVIGAKQVITNCHVAQKGKSLQVRQSDKTFKATLLYADPERDLCQLNVPNLKAPPIILGTAKKLRVGQRVYAIGAPKGLELTLSEGLISSLRLYEGSQYIQTSAAISPGSSGGGLFDDQGRLVGITTFQMVEGQNLNFALPVDWIYELPKRSKKIASASVLTKETGLNFFIHAAALDAKDDWLGLLELSQKQIKINPNNVNAWIILGNAYYDLAQYTRSISTLREALKIEPENAYAWFSLGLSYKEEKQFNEAIKSFREALRIDPQQSFTWYSLGETHLSLEQYDEAIKDFREVLRIDPENFGSWNGLGNSFMMLNKYDEAIHSLKESLRIKPENARTWFILGNVYTHFKQSDEAIKAYQEALRLDPKNTVTMTMLGLTYKEKKQFDEAIKVLRDALLIQPENTYAWISLGSTYFMQDKRDKVQEIYQELIKLNPAIAEKYLNAFRPAWKESLACDLKFSTLPKNMDLSVEIDYASRTVNNRPAEISDTEVVWEFNPDGDMVVLNRGSGLIEIRRHEANWVMLSGVCSRSSGK